jgi:hypothetical protein
MNTDGSMFHNYEVPLSKISRKLNIIKANLYATVILEKRVISALVVI